MSYIEFLNKKENTLKNYLKTEGISKRAFDILLKKGILVNDKKVYNNHTLKKLDIIKIPIDDEELDYEPIKGKLKILYEDEHIIIISKNSGITVNSKNQVSLASNIAYYFKEKNIKAKVRFVNRLDMNTSGILMVAKNKYAQAYYQKQIEDNKFVKKYLAFVEGRLNINKEVRLNLAYDDVTKSYKVSGEGKEAITIFKSIKTTNNYSLIESDIKTGKTHQIRSSLSYLGHPIIGDKLYGSKIIMDRFLLHAFYIKFNQFMNGESIIIKDLPDFKLFIKKI